VFRKPLSWFGGKRLVRLLFFGHLRSGDPRGMLGGYVELMCDECRDL